MVSTENQVPAALPNQGTADTVKYLSSQLDVEGFSHGRISGPGAAAVHAANPTKPVISSECCSCQTQRGEDCTRHTPTARAPCRHASF